MATPAAPWGVVLSRLERIIFDPDTIPPSIPVAGSVVVVGQTRLDVSWAASTDSGGSGLAGYNLSIDGAADLVLGVQITYSHLGLAAGSTHTYRVRARDGNGNLSAYSNQIQGTTQSGVSPTALEQDWVNRSTMSGGIAAHDFREDNELYNFIRGENTSGTQVTNPSPRPPGSLTLVSAFGNSRAIRSAAFGTTLTATAPAANPYPAHDTQVWQVANASNIPDPAGTPYQVLVGNGSDSGGIEWVEVQSRNTSANTVTVRRKMTAEDGGFGTNTAPSFPVGYTLGRGPNGSWNRPFAAFPSGQNGRSVADIGIANGTVTKQRVWSGNTPNSSAHANFREAYFGHRSYWADSPQTYRNWTPQDGGGTRTDAWDGDEIFIQWRSRISASRFNAPEAKMLFLQNANVSGSGQFFWTVGGNKYGEKLPTAEQVPGVTYGSYLVGLTSYADSAAPAGGILGSVQTDSIDNNQPIQDGYPDSKWNQRPNNFLAWCFPADRWVTYLLHFKFGKDNATADPSDTLPFPTAPFPSASDASFRTLFELYVADEGDTDYKLITSDDNFTWFFGDNKFSPGTYFYNPPGLNTLWMSQNLNDYVGAGSVSPPASPHQIDYTQYIASKNWVAPPADTLPTYMAGMNDWDVRALSGTYVPSNGTTSLYDVVPADWKAGEGTSFSEKIISAWSGGARGDPHGLRLFVHGGGHGDSGNNGLYAFDLHGDARPVGWSVHGISPFSARTPSTNTYSDGKPTAIHSYDQQWYDPIRKRFYRAGGSGYGPGGAGISWYGYYDFNTAAWVQLGSNSAFGALASSLVGSPDGKQLFFLSSTTQPRFIDTTSGALTVSGSSPFGSEEMSPCFAYDRKRRRWFGIYTSGAYEFSVDWNAKTWSGGNRTLTGTFASAAIGKGVAIFYDGERDLFWTFGHSGATSGAAQITHIYSIHPTTYAVNRFALNSAISCGGGPNQGTYNRYVWLPQYRMLVTVQRFDAPVQIVKIPRF